MTANGSAKLPTNLLSAAVHWFRSSFRLIGRVALGGLAIIAAGIVAIAMAILGLLIAIAALIFRFTRGNSARPTQERTGAHKTANREEGVILEARQTGQGWTVE